MTLVVSFSNTKLQLSTEDVVHMLQSIKYIVLTWPSAAQTNEDRYLWDSMTESLKFMLAHLQTNDDRASDSEFNENDIWCKNKIKTT